MRLQDLLDERVLGIFIEENLHRLPFALPGAARDPEAWASWDAIGRLTTGIGVDALLVRDGQTRSPAEGSAATDLQNYCSDGWTIRIRNVQQHDGPFKDMATSFEEVFRGSVNVHIYATPAGRRGLGWHYDAEDVFILQTAGAKEYFLRKNTVHPWPLAETMPEDLRYERELMPLSRILLNAGDLLYIPCGYWHRTESPSNAIGDAISVAVGIMSPSGIDLLDHLRRKFADTLVWRQRLPVGTEGNLEDRLTTLLKQLAEDFSATIMSPDFRNDLIASMRRTKT